MLHYEVREITPGPFLDELWNCLSTLRRLLAFPNAWTSVQQYVWKKINGCATGTVHHLKLSLLNARLYEEGEMLQFPVSLLTAAAIIDGTVDALMSYFEAEQDESMDVKETESILQQQADNAVAGVIDDIKDVLDVSKVCVPLQSWGILS